MGFYSLNPQGRYKDEFKPRPVATTRVVATQQVQPAQTVSSPYRMQTRADGGTDFYNGNNKTTIEEYAKNTGNQVDSVRGYLANNGNQDEQRILTKRYYETKDPEVSKYNNLDVNAQRDRLKQLRTAASRSTFNNDEDRSNQRWATDQLSKVQAYGKNKAGNLGTFIADFGSGVQQSVGNLADLATQGNAVVETWKDDINPFISKEQKDKQLLLRTAVAEDMRNKIKDARTITGESLNRYEDYKPTGDIGRDFSNVAGRSLQAGIDATTFINPTTGLVRTAAGRSIARPLLPQIGRESLLYGGATGAQAGLQTYGETGDIEQSLAAAGNGLLTGAGTQAGLRVAGPIIGKTLRPAVKNAQELAKMTPIERQRYIEQGFAKVPDGQQALPLDSSAPQVGKTETLDKDVTLYHGSRDKIDTFDLNHLNATYMHDGLGINFTDSKDFAKLYSRGKNQWGEINKFDDGKGFINEKTIPKGTKVLDVSDKSRKVADILSIDDFKSLAKKGRDKEFARKNLERNARNILTGRDDSSLVIAKKVSSMSDDELLDVAYNRLKDRTFANGEGLPDVFRQLIDVYGIKTDDIADVTRQFSKQTGIDVIKTKKADGSSVYTVLNPDKLNAKPTVTPQVGKTDPTAALKAEALKYKSADEFIKAQGEPLYHGTNREFDKFDIGMAGQRGDVGIHGHGIYLAKQRGLAKTYADSNVRNTGVHGGGSPTIIEAYVDNAKLYDMSKNELGLTSSGKELTDQLKRAGYDGTSKDMMGGQFTEYAIFDQNKVNTKQQLTDLYNQAHTQPTAPKVEAPQVGKTVNYLDTNTSQQVLNKSIQPKSELWSRWFKQSDYKALPEIEQDILKNPQIKDAGTSRMYDYYKEMFGEKMTYDEFLNKDITLYRGGDTRATNNMASYSLLERKAKRFGDVSSITVKPKDTYGMLGDFSEGEVFVPNKVAPQVGKTPKQPTPFEQSLQDAGIAPKTEAPTARSSFANQTVRRSKEVSDQLKAQVKSAEPTFQTVTDVERIAQSDTYLKKTGIKKATTDVKERLSAKQIDDQTVSDAIAVAKALDQKGNPANLLEASAIYEELSVKLSKAGQTVQAASLLNNRTPAGLQYGAIRALKKSGVEITDQMKKDIGGLVDIVRKTAPESYEDGLARFRLQEYVAKQVPSANTSKIIQLWKAGLLTSPRTSAGNLAGNTAESVFNKLYVDPLANVVDGLFSLFPGLKRSRSYTLRGIASGTKEGIVKGVSYFKTGYDPRNPAQKFDVRQIHYSDTPLGKAAEAYTQTVFKLMGVADQPFYYANLRNSLYDQAITTAKNQGLKGAEKQAFIKKFVTEPEKRAMQLADAEARYSVFQNETALGKAASRIKGMDGLPGDIAEFVIPFSGVPSSIATRMIERTPVGTAVEIIKQFRAKKFDQRAMTKAIANGSAAIPLIGAGYALANSGAMTLGYPTDKKERDLWEAEGKQPYSIKVGDQWLSLNYFQPAGNLMAAGAEYAGARMDGKTSEEAFSQSLAGSGKAFSEQSFLKGVSSIGNAISDPSRFGQTFTESTAGSLVPNIVRTGARAFDPVKREVDNAGESIMAGIPGLRQNLDVKTNLLGEDIQRNSSPMNEIFNPTKPSDIQNADNPIIKELRRLQDAGEGIVPTEATKSSIPDIDTKELRKVNKQVAQEVASTWSTILSDPRYELLTDSDKKSILDRVNDTVFGAIKSDYKETKLNTRQQQYKDGKPVDYFDGFDVAAEKAKKDAKAAKVAAKKTSTKKASTTKKSRKDYKLFGFEQADPQSVGKNLRKLIEQAVI